MGCTGSAGFTDSGDGKVSSESDIFNIVLDVPRESSKTSSAMSTCTGPSMGFCLPMDSTSASFGNVAGFGVSTVDGGIGPSMGSCLAIGTNSGAGMGTLMGAGMNTNLSWKGISAEGKCNEASDMGNWKGSGKGKGKPVDGSRLQGHVMQLSTEGGTLRHPGIPAEVPFNAIDLPAVLQQNKGALTQFIHIGAKVLFTLKTFPSSQFVAKEVMPIPAPEAWTFGLVKSYGANSGYGFIEPVEDSPFTHDVYFNCNDFAKSCGDSMRLKLQGATVKFHVRLTRDGMAQAKEIELITRPEGVQEEEIAHSAGRICSGIIRTYKQNSGFGFISCPDIGKDVWFPRRELPTDIVCCDLRGYEVTFELGYRGTISLKQEL